VPALGHDQPSDVGVDPPVAEQRGGGGQLGVQHPRHPEPAGSLRRRHVAGQGELVGDPPPDRPWVRQHRLLLGDDLGAGEPDRQRRLRCRRGGLNALQQRDLINPGRIRVPITRGRVGRGGVGQLSQPGQHRSQPGVVASSWWNGRLLAFG
jgi:hypothetical protein